MGKMKDITIDELMQSAAYLEWKFAYSVSNEHEKLLERPCERREIAPISEIIDENNILHRLEIYLIKGMQYEVINVPLYASKVSDGVNRFLNTIYTNYLVIREITKRLGNENLITRSQYEDLTLKQLKKAIGKVV